ncbi:COMPASS subunit protein [Maudiozyma humilis]|uniref:COMPASS subunit protein n=1 Tax=Maudiozyma humilis TaxID=51915 RepID=A0AAV5S2J9_MAUHU|nr:COMPASS subunit protein [Kazachstania humilis]
MNLLLQDPFAVLKEFPERLVATLRSPLQATCVAYAPGGEYLACGTAQGAVVVYARDTQRPVQVLGQGAGAGPCHVRPVQSLAWSRDGRRLLSCGQDGLLLVWDLAAAARDPGQGQDRGPEAHVQFDAPVWGACWVEGAGSDGSWCIAASVYERGSAVLLSRDSEGTVHQSPLDADLSATEEDQGYVLVCVAHPVHRDVVVTGSSRGYINFFRCGQRAGEGAGAGADGAVSLLHGSRPTTSNIKHIAIAPSGERLAINSSDRSIRQMAITWENENVALSLEHKYQDVINRLQWNDVQFSSHGGDYLVASPHGSSAHDLYLWETAGGSLVRVLEGADEELMGLDWSFRAMTIAATGLESGDVYEWGLAVQPKWSALAPDFEEIEENIDYREHEDEFDVTSSAQERRATERAARREGEPIDLVTTDERDVRGNEVVQGFVIPLDYAACVARGV